MRTSDSLRDIERQAYRSTFEDGIYDSLFGSLFLILAWVPVLEEVGISQTYAYLLGLVPIVVAMLGKRYITVPRLGAVEFGPRRKSRRRLVWLIGAVVLFLQAPLLLTFAADGLLAGMTANAGISVAMVLVVAPLIVIAAYFLDYPRMYIYAAVLMFGTFHSAFLHDFIGMPLNTLISFGVPGAVIFVFGLVLLYRFVTEYPKPEMEADHVSH